MRRLVLASALLLAFVSARQRAIHPAPPPAGPTFSKEVVRIFQANCQTCHHPGDIAPFSLMTYADVAPWASDIKLMTRTRQILEIVQLVGLVHRLHLAVAPILQ